MWRRSTDPVAQLRKRLDAFGSTMDRRQVLEPEAVRAARDVLEQVSGRLDERSAEAVFLVACFHWYRYQVLPAGQDQAELAKAVELTEMLLATVPELVPPSLVAMLAAHGGGARQQRQQSQQGGGSALFREAAQIMGQAEQTGDYRNADRAADLLRRAVAATPAGDPGRLHYTSALGRVHRDIFLHRGRSPQHLRKAVELHRESLESTPAGDGERPVRMFNLGNVLGDTYEMSGDRTALNESISLLGDAERARGADPRIRAMAQGNLGQRLRDRWLLLHDPADLDRAIETLAEAVVSLPDPRLKTVLGTACAERFLRTRAPEDRDAAIAAYEQAPEGDGVARIALAALLGDRHEASDDPADLDAAIDAYLAAAEEQGPDPSGLRHAAGKLFEIRYARDRRGDDLNEAIYLLRLGVDGAPDDVERGVRLVDLAYTLSRWHAALAGVDALGLAEEALVEAERLLPAGHPGRPDLLNNLGNLWREIADRTGDAERLEPAAAMLREAVSAAGAGSPKLPVYLSNLGLVLQALFGRTQDRATLAEAIEVLRRGLASGPLEDDDRLALLINFGSALNRWVEAVRAELGRPADAGAAEVATAVTALREAARLARERAEADEVAKALGTLALANLLRHEITGETEALDEAVGVLEEALDVTEGDLTERYRFLTNLGNALLTRSRLDGREADLPAAVQAYREAPLGLPAGHAERTMCLINLAVALKEVEGPGAETARDEAMAALREAAAVETAPSLLRATAAQSFAGMAEDAGDLTAALEAYASTIELLDLVAWHGMDPEDQARMLTRFAGLAGAAAACAVDAEQPERAVELLEYGRGVLLTRVRDARVSLDELRERAPELAAQLEEVQSRLDGLAPGRTEVPEQRHELTVQRRELLEVIRRRPGFEGFLRPPAFADLVRAAGHGPVALVNVAARRCDALLVDRDGVRVIPLPELTMDDLVVRVVAFLDAVRAATGPSDPQRRKAARPTITGTLEWLWSAVAQPVLDAIDAPRLWWCPTGLLSLLPLHAAGPVAGDGVLDRVVPSYTASLRAMPGAGAGTGAVDAAVFVGMPHTPGLPDLPGVFQEQEIVTRYVTRVDSLIGSEATREAVKTALAGHAAAHLSCHGVQELAVPALGRLALADGPLTVRDLWELRATGPAGLAVLSACDTVRGGALLPDETISLGTALQLAGFRHVIGSLWSISDAVTAELCERLYAGLAVPGRPGWIDPERAAVALHDAVCQVRRALRDAPEFWAAYAHFGP